MTTREKFDSAAWVGWAERLGNRLYLWDTYGDGCLRMSIVEPERGRGRNEKEGLDLWWGLRPKDADANARHENQVALFRFLWNSGRIGPPEMRPACAKAYTVDGIRPSPRHLANLKRLGITPA